MNKKYIEETKKILRHAIGEEKENLVLDVNFFPVTIIEFYTGHIAKFLKSKQSISSKYYLVTLPRYASGVNINEDELDENNIFLFLKRSRTIKKNDRNLYTLLHTCYHELWHSVQLGFDEYSYEGFLRGIDLCLQNISYRDYLVEHPKYSFEIGANLYAVTKVKEYIQKYYPEIYEKEKDYIDKKEQQVKFYYQTYDLSDNIEIFIKELKKIMYRRLAEGIDDLYEISPVLPIFLNDNMTFKKIYNILDDEKFKILDKRIIYAFFSNITFLESVDFDELTDEELNIIKESLEYTSKLYQNQLKILENEKKVNLLNFLEMEKNILKKYKVLNYYLKRKIKHKLNFRRSDNKKVRHMNNISRYLDKTNTLIRKRNRGYITINIFYLFGLVLSVFTIGYLLIRK